MYREVLRRRHRPRNVADSAEGIVDLPVLSSRTSRRRLRPRWISGSGDDSDLMVMSCKVSVAII
jgi:hypothetical protein